MLLLVGVARASFLASSSAGITLPFVVRTSICILVDRVCPCYHKVLVLTGLGDLIPKDHTSIKQTRKHAPVNKNDGVLCA